MRWPGSGGRGRPRPRCRPGRAGWRSPSAARSRSRSSASTPSQRSTRALEAGRRRRPGGWRGRGSTSSRTRMTRSRPPLPDAGPYRASGRAAPLQLDPHLVAAVLRLLGGGVVVCDEGPLGAHPHRHHVPLGDALRHQLPLHARRPLRRELLVVRRATGRVGVAGDLELVAANAGRLEPLLGAHHGIGEPSRFLVAPLLQLVGVALEGALVLAALLEEALVHLLLDLAHRSAPHRLLPEVPWVLSPGGEQRGEECEGDHGGESHVRTSSSGECREDSDRADREGHNRRPLRHAPGTAPAAEQREGTARASGGQPVVGCSPWPTWRWCSREAARAPRIKWAPYAPSPRSAGAAPARSGSSQASRPGPSTRPPSPPVPTSSRWPPSAWPRPGGRSLRTGSIAPTPASSS